MQRRDRFSYQKHYVRFDPPPLGRVLDIGSGDRPFPYATVLVDRFLEISKHRHQPLDRADKPLILADVHSLPFTFRAGIIYPFLVINTVFYTSNKGGLVYYGAAKNHSQYLPQDTYSYSKRVISAD